MSFPPSGLGTNSATNQPRSHPRSGSGSTPEHQCLPQPFLAPPTHTHTHALPGTPPPPAPARPQASLSIPTPGGSPFPHALSGMMGVGEERDRRSWGHLSATPDLSGCTEALCAWRGRFQDRPHLSQGLTRPGLFGASLSPVTRWGLLKFPGSVKPFASRL